jgi:hypothetical protein
MLPAGCPSEKSIVLMHTINSALGCKRLASGKERL